MKETIAIKIPYEGPSEGLLLTLERQKEMSQVRNEKNAPVKRSIMLQALLPHITRLAPHYQWHLCVCTNRVRGYVWGSFPPSLS